ECDGDLAIQYPIKERKSFRGTEFAHCGADFVGWATGARCVARQGAFPNRATVRLRDEQSGVCAGLFARSLASFLGGLLRWSHTTGHANASLIWVMVQTSCN